jgi:uncharacterized protein (TIGR02301 family)
MIRIAPALIATQLAALLCAGPAMAARSDDLAGLAHALGQSQAIREACDGAGDQHWRSKYMRLMDLEKSDEAGVARVKAAFGAGYAQAKADYADCSPEARAALAAAAGQGRALAEGLAGPTPPAPAEPVAEAGPAR